MKISEANYPNYEIDYIKNTFPIQICEPAFVRNVSKSGTAVFKTGYYRTLA
jgi:hypothetical protein